jgi:hypothetical protein
MRFTLVTVKSSLKVKRKIYEISSVLLRRTRQSERFCRSVFSLAVEIHSNHPDQIRLLEESLDIFRIIEHNSRLILLLSTIRENAMEKGKVDNSIPNLVCPPPYYLDRIYLLSH